MESPAKVKHRLTVIGLVVVAIAATISIVLLTSHRASAPDGEAEKTANTQQGSQSDTFTIDEAALPAGWNVQMAETSNVQLRNESTKCFVGVVFSVNETDTKLSEADHAKGVIGMIKSKGADATESTGTASITTKGGTKELASQDLQVTVKGTTQYQKYVHIVKDGAYYQAQLSCPTQDALSDAQAALKAVTFDSL